MRKPEKSGTIKRTIRKGGIFLNRITCISIALALCLASSGCDPQPPVPEPFAQSAVPAAAPAEPTASEQFLLLLDRELSDGLNSSLLNRFLLSAHPDTCPGEASSPLGHLPTEEQEAQEHFQTLLENLRQIPQEELGEQEQWLFRRLSVWAEQQLSLIGLEYYPDYCTAETGIPQTLPQILCTLSIRSARDAEDYLTLLADIPRYFAELEECGRQKQQRGTVGSASSWRKTAEFCRTFAGQVSAAENPLYTSFLDRIDDRNPPEEERAALSERCLSILTEQVNPAYLRLADTLEQLIQDGPVSNGRWASLDGGKDAYALYAAAQTGSRWTLDEMSGRLDHALSELSEQANRLAEQNQAEVRLARRYFFPVYTAQEVTQVFEDACREDFPPFASEPVEFLSVPDFFDGQSVPARLHPLPLDADRGMLIFNSEGRKPTRLYHLIAQEVYPGRLYQQRYAQSTRFHPVSALIDWPGFSNGWAVYAEYQAAALAVREAPEVVQAIQTERLLSLLFCARASIGVHEENWTEYKLSQYLEEYGFSDRQLARDIYRTVLESPFSYLSEGVGFLELMEFRQQAEHTMGSHFQPAEFHRLILENGPAPFFLLAEKIEEWIG